MDPSQETISAALCMNHAEQMRIVARMLDGDENPDYLTDAQRLAELVRAYDKLVRKYGIHADAWDETLIAVELKRASVRGKRRNNP